MSDERAWIATAERLPLEGEVVDTKVHDERGERNVQPLYWRGRLWFVPDGRVYIYYTPTHWRPLS